MQKAMKHNDRQQQLTGTADLPFWEPHIHLPVETSSMMPHLAMCY